MLGQFTSSRKCKSIAAAAIVGFVLASYFHELDGASAQWCILLDKTPWVLFEVLRPVVLVADWQAVWAYLFEGSRILELFLQIGACVWPLLCVATG